LTLACSPDFAAASDHHIVEARRLLINAIRLLNPTPRMQIAAPANVHAVVSDNPSTRPLRVHLLGYNSPPQTTPAKNRPHILPGLIEDAPMYRVAMEFEDDIRGASACGESTELQRDGRRVLATVNDVHEVVIVKY
jgi:hypothetical protein